MSPSRKRGIAMLLIDFAVIGLLLWAIGPVWWLPFVPLYGLVCYWDGITRIWLKS